MKGLKKVALVSAIAAVSAGAQAELKALDDAAMGELTGQAGLTIDIETKYTIGEFAYRDQDNDPAATAGGSVLFRGISMGGNTDSTTYGGETSSYLDNVRLTLDVAGSSAAENGALNYGFSEIGKLSAFVVSQGATDANLVANATVAATIQAGGTGLFTDFGTTLASGSENAGGTGGVVGVADLGIGQFAAGLGGSVAQATEFDLTDPLNPVNLGTSENGSDAAGIEDGDLVIHISYTDPFHAGGGFEAFYNGTGAAANGATGLSLSDITWEMARDVATRAVDFNFSIDEIKLADSAYEIGSGNTTGTTTLISGLDVRGYLGVVDIHIENDGDENGADGSGIDFNGDGSNLDEGNGNADSKITWGSYFRITDLDVSIDIAGINLIDVQIHNDRGDLTGLDGTSSFGFAHSRRTIYAVEDTVQHLDPTSTDIVDQYGDGLALNTEFKGDIDVGALTFGDDPESIGQLFFTDIDSDTRWTISAH